jgi:hypothetical protein
MDWPEFYNPPETGLLNVHFTSHPKSRPVQIVFTYITNQFVNGDTPYIIIIDSCGCLNITAHGPCFHRALFNARNTSIAQAENNWKKYSPRLPFEYKWW